MTAKGIIEIVKKGSSVIVDCRKLSYDVLYSIMGEAYKSGAKITLRHICFSDEDLDRLLGVCPKQITLDLTDIELDVEL